MAVTAATQWEIRTTGSQTNGGGFADLVPGTSVDYSQQTTAQLALTDIVTAGTVVTSVTGGFTAAMQGNVIYLGGGSGITEGWYQITSHTDTNTIGIDRTAGAAGSGGTGNVGGAWLLQGNKADTFLDDGAAGNTYWYGPGTHLNNSAVNTVVNGTAALKIKHYGYKTTRGDEPTGSNRPIVQYDYTSGAFYPSDHCWFSHLIIEIGGLINISLGGYTECRNCVLKSTTSGLSRTTTMLYVTYGAFYNCEFQHPTGYTTASHRFIYASTGFIGFHYCYFHGSNNTNGISIYATMRCQVIGCVFSKVYRGYSAGGSSDGSGMIVNSLFYNCSQGIYIDHYFCPGWTNNIFHSCIHGVYGSSSGYASFARNCCFYNNSTADIFNGVDDGSNLFVDPKLVDPSNGDFTLDSGSPCFDAGMGLGTHVGLPV